MYIWMYTNGILATYEKMKVLADEGLNEIRFNVGATGYDLDKVKLAKQVFTLLFPDFFLWLPVIWTGGRF